MSTSPAPRGPGVVYGTIGLVLIVLVAVVALNAPQTPPPAIAEFAPQAIERIEEAPPEQAGRTGGGPGVPTPEATAPGESPSASPSAFPTNVPRFRRCYGDPPRQTEDPQSPPCAPYWDPKQDNGGRTWRGVTRNEIRIAWPQTIEKPRDTLALEKYFNMRYEFYGRKIRLVGFGPSGGVFGGVDAAAMKADADSVADELDAFASIAYVPRAGAEHHYYDRLATKHGIISADSHASMRTESHLAKFDPYEWSYLPSFDVMMRNFGEFVCRALAGRPPDHAGAGVEASARTFGLVWHRSPEGSTPDRSVLKATLRACDVEPAVETELTTADQTILKLKSRNVTTVICLCQGGHYFDVLMPEATNQVWFPEWLVSSYHYLDYDATGQEYPREHSEHVLGVTFHNKWLAQKEMPWYQAIKEAEPNYETGDDGYASAAYERYYELLLIASGIQTAGPKLTPETFRKGLFDARFPKAGSGRAPLWYSGGGFGPGHSMVDDGTMIWWSQTESGYTTNVRRGTFCYIGDGRRYGIGRWPGGRQDFFEGTCK